MRILHSFQREWSRFCETVVAQEIPFKMSVLSMHDSDEPDEPDRFKFAEKQSCDWKREGVPW